MPEYFDKLGKLGRGVYGIMEISKVRIPPSYFYLSAIFIHARRYRNQLLRLPLLSDLKSMSLLPQFKFGKSASLRNKAHRLSQCNMPMHSCSSAFSSSGVYSYVRT
jgi:hypothetical protein